MKSQVLLSMTNGATYQVPTSVIHALHVAESIQDLGMSAEEAKENADDFFQDDMDYVSYVTGSVEWKDIQPHAQIVDFKPDTLDELFNTAIVSVSAEPAKPIDVISDNARELFALSIESVVVSLAARGGLIHRMEGTNEDNSQKFALVFIQGDTPIVDSYTSIIDTHSTQLDAMVKLQQAIAARQPADLQPAPVAPVAEPDSAEAPNTATTEAIAA